MRTATSFLTLGLLLLVPVAFASADATTDAKVVAPAAQMGTADDEAKLIAQQIPSYPTMTCVVSGEAMGGEMGEPIDVLHEGRLVRLCCKMCVKELEKDPAAIMAKVDEAIIAAQGPSYPLDTCPVSGKELGAMGEPLNHIIGTRLVRLCCAGCVKGADKAPAATLEKINEALIAAQIKDYPLSSCPVSGKELGAMGEPVDFLYGTRLIRLCCGGCVKGAAKNPQAALAQIDAAFAAAKSSDSATDAAK